MEIRKAERRKAKLRMGIASTSGAGKTYSSLLLAFGLGGKVGMVDTENGSGDLYSALGPYDIIPLTEPFTVAKYREAIKMFEVGGYNTVIVDSLSHAWSGTGGILDKHGKISDITKNSYTAWRSVTPEHNSLVDCLLQSPCHIIATMRSKQDYAMETENGKTIVKKLGMAPIQRDGMEYEFTLMLDIAGDHTAHASKDRTGLFDGLYFKITPDTGKVLGAWLESGRDVPPPAPAQTAPATAHQAAPATQPKIIEGKKATGIIETVKSAKAASGMRYAIKLKGLGMLFGTASAPAAQRAEQMIGKEVDVTYTEEGKKLSLVGFDLAKV